MTRKTSFYYSFLVLPSPERRAITAVFDVCRAIDDAVDLESEPERAQAALTFWRSEVALIFGGGRPLSPQGVALQPFVKPFHLPREQFDALIDGVAMDVTPRRFRTFEDLEPYCHRVASSVGLMCAEIFRYSDPAVLTYARDLGVALQLTNILRDVGVDYRRGRMYLPLADLAQAGCTEDDIRREVEEAGKGISNPNVRVALEYLARRARQYFGRAIAALPRADARKFVAAEIMHGIYFELLKKIEAADFDVFTQLVRVPRPAQARLALRIWWTLRRGHIPQH
jgi:phytoene synthase